MLSCSNYPSNGCSSRRCVQPSYSDADLAARSCTALALQAPNRHMIDSRSLLRQLSILSDPCGVFPNISILIRVPCSPIFPCSPFAHDRSFVRARPP